MRTNYLYNGQPIPKAQFEKNVPENWREFIINGEYSWGYYNALVIE